MVKRVIGHVNNAHCIKELSKEERVERKIRRVLLKPLGVVELGVEVNYKNLSQKQVQCVVNLFVHFQIILLNYRENNSYLIKLFFLRKF